MSTALKNGGGDYFIPDTNKSFIGKKIDALDWIGYKELRETDGLSNNHPLAQAVFEKAKTHQSDLSLILGAKSNMFAKLNTPMQVCQKLASLTGYKFPRLRREGTRGNQVWIYGVAAPDFQKDDEGNLVFVDGRAVPVSDRREEVFTAWVERDILAREKAAKAKLEAQVQATIPNCQLSALAETEINTLTTLQEQYAEQKTQTLTEEVESIVITHNSGNQAMATPRASISVELPVENHQESTEAVIEKLLKISNWGEVAVSQAEINEVWPLLSENQRSHLWQLHHEYQQQLSLEELAQQAIATQAEIKETGFGSHFRSYVLKAVFRGIAIARKCWGDKQECSIPLNQLLLAN